MLCNQIKRLFAAEINRVPRAVNIPTLDTILRSYSKSLDEVQYKHPLSELIFDEIVASKPEWFLKDKIEWNAHRIYGKIRLPLVTVNFKLIDIVGKFSWEKANWRIQPILVLKNLFKDG